MKRTALVLSDEQAMLLERERRRRGVPAAAIVRDALDAYFGERSEPLAIAGIGRSGEENTARDAESIIASEWSYERLMGVAEASLIGEQEEPSPEAPRDGRAPASRAGGHGRSAPGAESPEAP